MRITAIVVLIMLFLSATGCKFEKVDNPIKPKKHNSGVIDKISNNDDITPKTI